jgi:hypothetical protein
MALSLLVFLLILEVSATLPALIGAALFATHPVHSEAVANVVGRAELYSALFVLWACLLFWKGGSLHPHGGSPVSSATEKGRPPRFFSSGPGKNTRMKESYPAFSRESIIKRTELSGYDRNGRGCDRILRVIKSAFEPSPGPLLCGVEPLGRVGPSPS